MFIQIVLSIVSLLLSGTVIVVTIAVVRRSTREEIPIIFTGNICYNDNMPVHVRKKTLWFSLFRYSEITINNNCDALV